MTKAYIAINTWSNTIVRKMRERHHDRGASVVEYAGLVVIIALIVVAVKGLNLDTTISTAIGNAVTKITGGGG
jgi:Flp pilus assembly pilin Flp